MRPTVVELVTLVRAEPGVVFDLELDADVHAASLAGSGERAVTSTGRPALGLGDEVTLTARHIGRRWRLTSRITAHDRPRRFVDEQVTGPFRSMRHEHFFEIGDDGRTRMTDLIAIEAPFGFPGAVVARLVLAPYLRRLLRVRADHVRRLAEDRDS